jgi:hypothetical protein
LVNDSAGLEEGLFDVVGSFSRSLHKNETVFPGETFSLFGTNLSTRVQITFVSDQHNGHIWVSILPNFLQPPRKMRESVSASDVVNKQCPCRTSVVRPRNGFKRLLPRGVPNLKLYVFSLNLNRASSKFNPNREIMLLTEPFVRELQEQA